VDADIETDVSNGRLLAFLAKNGEILSRTYAADRVSIHCRIPRQYLGQIQADEAMISLRGVGHGLPRNGNAFGNGHAANGQAPHEHAASQGEAIDDVA
jgi:hypothetical protein